VTVLIHETLESTDEMKWNLPRFYLTISLNFEIYFIEFPWESALGVISDNCLSLAFRKCKKESNMILKVFLVQGFCPLKTEIAGFLSAFVWRSQEEWEEQCQLHVVTVRLSVYLCIYFFRFFFCFLVSLVHLVLLYHLLKYIKLLATCVRIFSIYTLSDLGVLSNRIGSLSLANEHCSPPTEWIMRKPSIKRV